MKAILIYVLLLVNFEVFANGVVHFSSTNDQMVTIQDQSNPNRILVFLMEEEIVKIWNHSKSKFEKRNYSFDKECMSNSLIYVHPVLANVKTTCIFDQEIQRVVLIGETSEPKDNFSFAFLFQDDVNTYFVVNGRDFPSASAGYIMLKTVNKRSQNHHIVDLIVDVPGLSGGMNLYAGSQTLYYTLATGMGTNIVYGLPLGDLKSLVELNIQNNFMHLAKKIYGPFQGLTFHLTVSEYGLLYNNRTIYGEYESYLILNNSGTKKTVELPKDCSLVGTLESSWLFNCSGTKLVSFNSDDLFE
ncbi:MAG: hypothetical protein HN353_06545 [Bdellovibrionales bacterium]|jgi:hypothetical protein|nr:hypothetical protein [Bdellovibrionales bacterium]MBT3526293.1 hypothetical protein [Bdellovibrionales bacterium]MBT7670202.1 hypothetical protein [Bdellovibrionales bacterium]MBT7765866.1 hypothetical protein [Bdellovibrionales bacterium]